MKIPLILKILLVAGYIGVALYLANSNYFIDTSINDQYTALGHLKNDPKLDSSVNRERRAESWVDITQKIQKLREQRHSEWYKIAGIILIAFTWWVIRRVGFPSVRLARIKKRDNS